MINKIEMIIFDENGEVEKEINLKEFEYHKSEELSSFPLTNESLKIRLGRFYDFKEALEKNNYDSFNFLKNEKNFDINLSFDDKTFYLSSLNFEIVTVGFRSTYFSLKNKN